MNRRTRLLVAMQRRLPRPDEPSARYLARLRRELPRGAARLLLGQVGRDVLIRDITVPVTDTLLTVRVYRHRELGSDPVPLVVNLHGGGFVMGNLTAADWLCGQVAARAKVIVASVDYRLAPEYPAPTPFTDSWRATRWLIEHAGLLGGDRSRVTVMGESAGANLAALIALASRDLSRTDPSWPPLTGQILAYPAVDLTLSSPSIAELADAPMLRRATLDWYGRLYLPQGLETSIAGNDPRVSPIFAADHADLPPALVLVAGADPLRDDGTRYAAVLAAAGVRVRTQVFPEAIHGFLSIPLFEPAAHQAAEAIVAELTASVG
jgi:acetyl esterase